MLCSALQELQQLTESLKARTEFSSAQGEKDVNRRKNRYKDILPLYALQVLGSTCQQFRARLLPVPRLLPSAFSKAGASVKEAGAKIKETVEKNQDSCAFPEKFAQGKEWRV
ncbi:hypothetical protein GWK47_008669 [Chionoecetes opilio]|uniref:Uncharacterized protein n=1 Tax=Chionoecetes opilio TaxID=41210 RepID=A0A8J4Y5W9_CHIOP|nr:hypothetical protein GWK47_008669 [Chionoecetes opilio]